MKTKTKTETAQKSCGLKDDDIRIGQETLTGKKFEIPNLSK